MPIYDHTQLDIFRSSFDLAVRCHHIACEFPPEEKFRLTDQLIRASRSPCASIAEGFRKRFYPKHFINKIIDAEAEVAETRVWLQFGAALEYCDPEVCAALDGDYQKLLAQLVNTRRTSPSWARLNRGQKKRP